MALHTFKFAWIKHSARFEVCILSLSYLYIHEMQEIVYTNYMYLLTLLEVRWANDILLHRQLWIFDIQALSNLPMDPQK